jgi:hypothetical protein
VTKQPNVTKQPKAAKSPKVTKQPKAAKKTVPKSIVRILSPVVQKVQPITLLKNIDSGMQYPVKAPGTMHRMVDNITADAPLVCLEMCKSPADLPNVKGYGARLFNPKVRYVLFVDGDSSEDFYYALMREYDETKNMFNDFWNQIHVFVFGRDLVNIHDPPAFVIPTIVKGLRSDAVFGELNYNMVMINNRLPLYISFGIISADINLAIMSDVIKLSKRACFHVETVYGAFCHMRDISDAGIVPNSVRSAELLTYPTMDEDMLRDAVNELILNYQDNKPFVDHCTHLVKCTQLCKRYDITMDAFMRIPSVEKRTHLRFNPWLGMMMTINP